MSRYVGISSEDYSRGGHSGSSGGSTYGTSNMTGFGSSSFGQGTTDSRPSYDSSYARGYDSNPKFENRESREAQSAPSAPKVQLSFFEQPKAAVPDQRATVVNEPRQVARPLAPPSLFEPPKVSQPPVKAAIQEERRPAAPVDIFAPPAVTKQQTAQVRAVPSPAIFQAPAPAPQSQSFIAEMPAFVTPAPAFTSPAPAFTSPPQQLFAAPGPAFVPQVFTSQPEMRPTPAPVFTNPTPTFPAYTSPPATFTSPPPVNYPATVLPQYTAPPKPVVPPTLTTPQAYSYPPQPKPTPQPDPRFRLHHNMDAYSGPTLGELKASPSLKEDFTDFHAAPGEQTKSQPVDLESMLVNLDNLRVETKKKDDPRHNIGF